MQAAISVQGLLAKLDSFSTTFDTRGARDDLKQVAARELVVREVPVDEVLSIWQLRAELARARGDFLADIQLLVDRLTQANFSVAGEVFLSAGVYGTVFFLDPQLSAIISIVRRPSEGDLS